MAKNGGTGKPMLETFDRATAEKINQDKYEVLTTLEWLKRFNKQLTIKTD